MNNPVATYRLQFHSAFTLAGFEQIITYLQKLGVSTIYASPVFEAVPGSTHGYDSVNPHRINPEIGTLQQLRAISGRLKQNNMGWLQDIVPNHMGYHQNNPWLMDVLEKGKHSLYTPFFDAVWTSPLFNDEPLMVPFLGNSLGDAIAGDELTIALDEQGLVFKYAGSCYPLNAGGYADVLKAVEQPAAIALLLKKLLALQKITAPRALAIDWVVWKQRLVKALKTDDNKTYLEECLTRINNNKTLLRQIADKQYYRLCSWQETDRQINYRRFFTVNSLICLNIQDKAVFDHFHEHIKTLVADGVFTGLRIDHIDGLYDPDQYMERLRQLAGNDTYIVAEKILEQGEELPTHWPLQGTTGYDFLAMVNNLLTNASAQKKLTRFYNELVPGQPPVKEQIWQKKADILFNHMGGELDNLYGLLKKLRLTDKGILAGIAPEVLKKAIGQVLIHCPVYRYYGNQLPLPQREYDDMKALFAQAKANSSGLKAALNLLEVILLEKPKLENIDYNRRAGQFYQRLMQFSGPLMAKGVEDTLMYTYNCFITHNEVGDAPDAFGLSVKAFHKLMQQRQKLWPLAINGTATHDTKRGEDVRARLNVLSDMPKAWIKAVQKWQQLNAGLKQDQAPDTNDEYFIYQTLLGAHPLPGQPDDDFAVRLQEYLTKALREAKTHSNWAQPDAGYEQATTSFAAALLNEQSEFYASFKTFLQRTADFGILNSLVQVLLKFTCPGVPDVYQGCELWDLNLVDPDNRRPVDYALRTQYLNSVEQLHMSQPELLAGLWHERNNAKIKQWLTHKLFTERRQMPDVFAKGDYIALPVKGAYKKNIIAFARRYQQTWYITVAALHLAELCREQERDLPALKWKNTRIIIPPEAPAEWHNLLSGANGQTAEDGIRVKELFGTLPMALLKLEHTQNNRGAGVLMHISSLPSAYGIGDMGPGAHAFADFLGRSGQQYWQLLPLNPVTAREGYSPYSTASSMAGNPLFISPELLAADGLLTAQQLAKFELPAKDKVNYEAAQKNKHKLLNLAYQAYEKLHQPAMQQAFADFCSRESYWLNDYTLYAAIKQHHANQPWFEWPHEYRDRKNIAVKRFAIQNLAETLYLKWLQFIFHKQWQQLKSYCHMQNIKLFGDIPFYVSYDSADVWGHPDYFCLDADGGMTGVAGVPPDYFNSNGQLWGMPIFRWDKLKARGYDWWINRLRKNMELFDLVRLDHFRAFSAYWEVPATETTAINGKWKPGPGKHFFEAVQQALGGLPFIAEDLGDIDQPVYQLRDDFNLPGMKVLQFAFGDDLSGSAYIPHNYQENDVVYTGTHDNNTTVGWFSHDAGKDIQQRVEQYTGQPVKAKNIHQVLGRIAYASTARIVILPMQDILGLDAAARMNSPASANGNWQWRLKPGELDTDIEKQLLTWVKLYNRI